jgi:hypothetical protein
MAVTDLITTSFSAVADAAHRVNPVLLAAVVVAVVVVNVLAAKSWAERRQRQRYTPLL